MGSEMCIRDRWYVTTDQQWGRPSGGLYLASTDGLTLRCLTPEGVEAIGAAVSPDGRTALTALVSDSGRPPRPDGLYRVEVMTGVMSRVVADEPDRLKWGGSRFHFAWRPDGKRIAVQETRLFTFLGAAFWTHEVFTCDPDGGNRRFVVSRGLGTKSGWWMLVGWR